MDVVFDFDGTLLEGGCYPFSTLIDLARAHGYVGSERKAQATVAGCTDFEVAGRLRIQQEPAVFTTRLLEANLRSLAGAWWLTELISVLRALAGEYSLHILSNRDQESLRAGVERLRLTDVVQTCVGTTQGVSGKPSTTLYRQLRTLRPSVGRNTIYVGDKKSDREFARRAGLRFVPACWYRRILEEERGACLEVEDLPAAIQEYSSLIPR